MTKEEIMEELRKYFQFLNNHQDLKKDAQIIEFNDVNSEEETRVEEQGLARVRAKKVA